MKKLIIIVLLFVSVRGFSQSRDSIHFLIRQTQFYQMHFDSLVNVIKAQNIKLDRIKHYIDLCNKNPKKEKYLREWINNALQESKK
ncbi:MAG: hypothetical protein JST87_05195 [Bacteroidetes bacterium]|nr:hypothetical protein [Bacteroidota bacterium]